MAQNMQSARVRLRIKSINVTFDTSPKYPTNLKLLSNGRQLFNLNAIYSDQALRWEDINPIDVDMGSTIEVRVYELHWLGKRRERVGAVEFKAHEMAHAQLHITARDNAGKMPFEVSMMMALIDNIQSAAQAQHAAHVLVEMTPSLLARMGRAKDGVDVIVNIGKSLAELNPIAKAVVGLFVQAWETLNKQDQCDALVADLVIEMGNLLPHMAAVEDHMKVANLKDTVEKLLHLVEDASRFILEYKSDGAAVRAIRAFVSSSAQGQVDELVKQLAVLKEDFDRGMATQVVKQVEMLLNDADQALLAQLLVPDARFDPSRSCLEGTRGEVIDYINHWALSPGSLPLFWLYAVAGCGKSSVATSIGELWYSTGILAGSFFCKRDSPYLREPKNVISHLAASLGLKYPQYGTKLVDALRRDPELARSATKTQFMGLLAEPLRSMSAEVSPTGTLTLVVDALDEAGSPESRAELMGYLLEMSKLKPWLKVFVTSRPNEEIRLLLGSSDNHLEKRNLFVEDEASVSRDILAYIHSRMVAIPADTTGCGDWPNKGDMQRLCDSSNGLFIWARTACNLIQQSLSPSDTMKQLIKGERSKNTRKAIGEIYTTALNEGLGVAHDQTEVVQLCVGLVILTGSRRPLPDAALAAMLVKRVEPHMLSRVISRLASVLYRDHTSAVRVLHQSFSDYMMEEDCPEEYRINITKQNEELAASCLEIMLRDLRFNMCNLEDSCVMNRDVPDLQVRISEKIKPELLYSCIYWANHLMQQSFESTHAFQRRLLDQVLYSKHALLWIEALSLIGELHVASMTLTQLIDWIDGSGIEYNKTAVVELDRFISAAFRCISESTPHLYVSALPFGVANYAVLRAMQPHFPNSMNVTGGSNLWNGRCVRIIQTEGVDKVIAVSSDGRQIASGMENSTMRIWNAQTGAASLQPLAGHSDHVTSAAFSSGGQHIVSGSYDETVRIWDIHTGAALLPPLKGHSSGVTCVAFSSDDRHVISGSEDKSVRIWDAQSGSIFQHLEGHTHCVTSVAISSDGQRIASGSRDKTVRIWDVQTGTALLQPLKGHSHSVASVAFSSNGQYVVSGSWDRTVQIWNAQTGAAHLLPLKSHSDVVVSVAFSSDSRYIVSGSWDHTIQVCDVQTGAALFQPNLRGHLGSVTFVAFLSNTLRIISGSFDRTVRIWDARIGSALLQRLQGHSDGVRSIAFSSDGRCIVSGSQDSTVRIWDAQTGAALSWPLKGHLQGVSSVAFSSDSRHIASGSQDRTVRIWDAQTGTASLQPLEGHLHEVSSVAFSPDSRYIASGSKDKTVRIWDTQTGTLLVTPFEGHLGHVTSVAFSSNGQCIVSGSRDRTVRIWDVQTGTSLFTPLEGHLGYVTSVAFSPDSRYIVSGSVDGTVRIWDAQTGAALLQPLGGQSDYVTSVAFSPDSQYIVSGSVDGAVRMWDTQTGRAFLQHLQGHSGYVTCVAFSPDGHRIVSSSSDHTIRIWDAKNALAPFVLQEFLADYSSSTMHKYTCVPSHILTPLLDRTGWVCHLGKRLLWVPPEYRRTRTDHSIFSITKHPAEYQVSFDLSKFKFGTSWEALYDPSAY